MFSGLWESIGIVCFHVLPKRDYGGHLAFVNFIIEIFFMAVEDLCFMMYFICTDDHIICYYDLYIVYVFTSFYV